MVPFGVESWSRPRKLAAEGGTKSERFGEHLLLLSLYQARLDQVWMSSWYSAGYGWLVTDDSGRSGSWDYRFEDEWFCLKCKMEPWRPGVILILNVTVSSWNAMKDLSVSQISMLTAWELNAGVNGTQAIHAWKTVLPNEAQKSGKDGWTKAVDERVDGLQLGWYGSDGSHGFTGFDGFDGHDRCDGSRGSDGVDGCDGVVVPSGEGNKVAQVLGVHGD